MSSKTGKSNKGNSKQATTAEFDKSNINWEDKRLYTWDLKVVEPANPEWDETIFAPIVAKTIKDENASDEKGISYTSFKVHQVVNNKLGSLLVKGHKSRGAIFETYALGKPKTPENFQGYQVVWDITSQETINNPTDEEQQALDYWDNLRKKTAEYGVEHLSEFDDDDGTFATIAANNPVNIVKEITPHPRMDDPADKSKGPKKKKIENKEKPRRITGKLLENRKKGTFITKLYGPGDVEVDPREYLGKPLEIEPIFKVDNVYVGQKKLSVQIKLWEANITPLQSSSRPRLIRKNEAPVEDAPQVKSSPVRPRVTKPTPTKEISNSDDPNKSLSPARKPVKKGKEEVVEKSTKSAKKSAKPIVVEDEAEDDE